MLGVDSDQRGEAVGGSGTPAGALWANLADFRAVAERELGTLIVAHACGKELHVKLPKVI